MLKTEGYENSELFMGLTPKNGYKASKLYSYKPINGNGDFVWTRNLSAYRLNQEGVLELMGANVPRIDYTNTCPELLIEKASTNVLQRSQEFDNAYWSTFSATITANSIEAPDGTLTADTLTEVAANDFHGVFRQNVLTSDTYTLSVYAKKKDRDFVWMILNNGAADFLTIFNINTGVIASNAGGNTATITNVGNGWYRCSISRAITDVGTDYAAFGLSNSGTNPVYVGDVTKGGYFWGAQLEVSDYATSYIPTTTASVTRPQDICYNTANGYLDSAWSVVMRVRLNNVGSNTSEPLLTLSDGSIDNYFCIYTDSNPKLYFQWYNNPDTDQFDTTDLANGIYNIGVSYDDISATYIIVINGTAEFSGTLSVNPPNTFSNFTRMDLGSIFGTGSPDKDGIIGVQYYNTALSQGDLENLTA